MCFLSCKGTINQELVALQFLDGISRFLFGSEHHIHSPDVSQTATKHFCLYRLKTVRIRNCSLKLAIFDPISDPQR